MEGTKTIYRWCTGCERRIAEQLFSANRCPGCHTSAKLKLSTKVDNSSSEYFTEEEYEAMGEILPGRDTED